MDLDPKGMKDSQEYYEEKIPDNEEVTVRI